MPFLSELFLTYFLTYYRSEISVDYSKATTGITFFNDP